MSLLTKPSVSHQPNELIRRVKQIKKKHQSIKLIKQFYFFPIEQHCYSLQLFFSRVFPTIHAQYC